MTGRWIAKITHNKKQVHIGLFDTKEEAHTAYLLTKSNLLKPTTKEPNGI